MHAQHHPQVGQNDRVAIARLLLAANSTYNQSNDPGNSYAARLEAREDSRHYLAQVMERTHDNAAAWGLLGRLEMDDGNLDTAQALFERSLSIDPDQPQQYTNLGYWALASERPALAEQYFQEALNRDRQSASAFCGMAHAKRQLGQFDVAYLHYRKLLQLNLEWPSIYSGMVACAAQLSVDQADQELAYDAITLLSRDDIPHQDLGRFVAAILRHQYDLDNPDARVLLEAAADDELLLLALEKTLMPDPAVESFVTLLRNAILSEVATTATLRDGLHRLAIGIALYADRTGYALPAGDNEARVIDAINSSVCAQFALGESMEAIAGSLMISALYGALFHQPFATQLGRWGLTEWPTGLQPLLAASYYHRATEEAIKQGFEEKQDELALAPEDVPQAWPHWQTLSQHPQTSLKAIMRSRLRLDTDNLPDTLRLMVCGADSGQRALELARSLSDVEIIAVDENLSNIARASRTAQDMGLEQIVFWPWSLASRFIADGNRVDWIELGRLPSTHASHVSLAGVVNQACQQGSIVHLRTSMAGDSTADAQIRQLIARHQLPETNDSLRQLRNLITENAQDPALAALLEEEDFYGLGGCHNRWFRPQDPHQLRSLLALMCNEVDWKLVRAQDSDGHGLALSPVQRQLRAEASGSDVQSVWGQPLGLYFMRRR
ncbi:tetratricopeptide repeat protein [Marinobacter sp. JSM 1782161]|uniref:tetratricopeptide repeat protein n=1 Tax=Marinobacter sp. JSM 1782161 TaxID=2685906 RepID=UPI0014028722|nr:tetratricopeptide repeat protein [Marinobacter sp. JSM 1782161]